VHYFLNFIKFPYVLKLHFLLLFFLISKVLFSQKQPAVEEKSQALEATLVPAVDQGQENQNSEVFVVEQAQELATSNAVPDEAKDAQPEQLAPPVLEISVQVYIMHCAFFSVAII
jgi:hypothetical protein